MDQQVSPCYHSFLTVTQSFHSKVTPIGVLYAEKIAEAVLLYVFRIAFPASQAYIHYWTQVFPSILLLLCLWRWVQTRSCLVSCSIGVVVIQSSPVSCSVGVVFIHSSPAHNVNKASPAVQCVWFGWHWGRWRFLMAQGIPPWVAKQGGLESSDWRLISQNSKTERLAFFLSFWKKKCLKF